MTLFDELQTKVDEGKATWEHIYYFIEAMIDSREDNDYDSEDDYEANM